MRSTGIFSPILMILRITFRLYGNRLRGIKGFGGPDKGLRSKTRVDKMWRRFCVGMSNANDLAKPQPEPPTGGVSSEAGARKQPRYVP
jgi:hypothetical protein